MSSELTSSPRRSPPTARPRRFRVARAGGGWASAFYLFRMAARAGGLIKFIRALSRRNACKTCALGMGGQRGGMVNEAGHFPEVCKKSMQAMAADMQGRIRPEFFQRYGFAELRRFTPRELELSGRLNEPLLARAGEARYAPLPWDDALRLCVQRLKGTPADQNFFYFSGRSSNEAAFLWQLFARLYGTNNVNNCSYYCHQASGVGLKSVVGSGTATVVLDDLRHCDLVFLIGGNPASNHPRMLTLLADLRRRGGHVIVINPLREVGLMRFRIPSRPLSLLFGSEIASLYLQPHIGGDIAVLGGIAKELIEFGHAADGPFIAAATDGFDAWREAVVALRWDEIVEASGVSRDALRRAAEMYASSRATIFAWTMGITHHVHGVDNVRAIANLALLRGMVGRPHAGLLPIRGHSNVQGVGSVGVVPQLAEPVLRRLESHFGVKLPTAPGMDTLACMEAMRNGLVRNAWCLGGNLFGSNPDGKAAAAAFEQLDFACYLSTTLNSGHAWGRAKETLILPVRARDEESQPTTQESMFNYVRFSEGGPPRLPGPRSEVELVAQLGEQVLGDTGALRWGELRDHARIRAAIAAIIPGYEKIGEIDRTRQEFQVAGRTFHTPHFNTPSGKARFHGTPLPVFRHLEPDELRLMSIRSEGQFNTVVYEEEDVYRGQERRDVILMNADDMRRLGLCENGRVTVRSDSGELRGLLVRPFDIRAGNAAVYYPEANVLVPRTADRESGTPAFKHVRVRVLADQTARLGASVDG